MCVLASCCSRGSCNSLCRSGCVKQDSWSQVTETRPQLARAKKWTRQLPGPKRRGCWLQAWLAPGAPGVASQPLSPGLCLWALCPCVLAPFSDSPSGHGSRAPEAEECCLSPVLPNRSPDGDLLAGTGNMSPRTHHLGQISSVQSLNCV